MQLVPKWFKKGSITLPSPAQGALGYNLLPISAGTAGTEGEVKLANEEDGVEDGVRFEPWQGDAARPSIASRLVKVWLFASPVLIAILLFALFRKQRPVDPTVINPYVCGKPSIYSSIPQLCAAGVNVTSPEVEEEVKKLPIDMDRSLTQEQCDIVFPDLYKEADRSRDYWRKRGGVTLDLLTKAEEKGQARVMIHNNRLYIKSYSDFQQGTRTRATLAAINEALVTALEPLPDIEFVIQSGDNGVVAGAPWALGRKADEKAITLIPDYGFFSWPEPGVGSFVEVQDKTLLYETNLTWAEKTPKLFWKGALMVNIRKEIVEIAKKYDWGAVSGIDWGNRDQVLSELLTPEQHCQYKYLAHVEGWAYSGRLKYLQQCRSVVVAHEMEYIQHFHHLFNSDWKSPDQNMVISPGRNFDQLPSVMDRLIKDDARAEQIAENSFKFYRHWLSIASVNCYWRRLFQRWAEVQNYTPEVHRGETSYNSFILMGKVHWDPYR